MPVLDRTRGKVVRNFFEIGIATLAAGTAALALSAAGCGGSSGGPGPSSGIALWITSQTNDQSAGVLEFTKNQLRHLAIANVSPKKRNLSDSFVSPQDTFFDSFNDLFVIDGGDGESEGEAVYAFTPKQLRALKKDDAPTPAFTITDLAGSFTFEFPQFGAFDSAGNLWVSDSARQVIFKFSAAQVNAGGGSGITPAGVIDTIALDGPLGLAFDADGDLWVANNSDESVVEFSAKDLATVSGVVNIIPAVILLTNKAEVPSLENPWGLAFDAAGDLWVTNENLPAPPPDDDAPRTKNVAAPAQSGGQGSIVEFTPEQLETTGSPNPNVQLTSTTVDGQPSIDDPNGDAIDLKDNFLFVANAAGSSVSGYDLTGIATGSPVPNVFVFGDNTTLNAPAGLIVGKAF
jgi:sugar lactone lactonase YvrE